MYRRFGQTYLDWLLPNTRLIINHLKGLRSYNKVPAINLFHLTLDTTEFEIKNVRDSTKASLLLLVHKTDLTGRGKPVQIQALYQNWHTNCKVTLKMCKSLLENL